MFAASGDAEAFLQACCGRRLEKTTSARLCFRLLQNGKHLAAIRDQKLLALCGISCCDIRTNGLEGLTAKKLTSTNNDVIPQAFSDYNMKTKTKTDRFDADAPSARQNFALLESVVRSGAVQLNSRASGGITLAALKHTVCEVHWCGRVV